MPLIADKDREAIKARFDKDLVDDVKLIYFTQAESPLPAKSQECAMCRETREILEEIASLSDKISLEVHDFFAEGELATQLGVDKIPAIILSGVRGDRVRFYGIPSGYEFSTLIEDIVDASKGVSGVSPKTAAQLATIDQPVHIQVFVTPT